MLAFGGVRDPAASSAQQGVGEIAYWGEVVACALFFAYDNVSSSGGGDARLNELELRQMLEEIPTLSLSSRRGSYSDQNLYKKHGRDVPRLARQLLVAAQNLALNRDSRGRSPRYTPGGSRISADDSIELWQWFELARNGQIAGIDSAFRVSERRHQGAFSLGSYGFFNGLMLAARGLDEAEVEQARATSTLGSRGGADDDVAAAAAAAAIAVLLVLLTVPACCE